MRCTRNRFSPCAKFAKRQGTCSKSPRGPCDGSASLLFASVEGRARHPIVTGSSLGARGVTPWGAHAWRGDSRTVYLAIYPDAAFPRRGTTGHYCALPDPRECHFSYTGALATRAGRARTVSATTGHRVFPIDARRWYRIGCKLIKTRRRLPHHTAKNQG